MSFIKRNWIWIVVGVLVYMNWDKVKGMILGLKKGDTSPGDKTPLTPGTKVPEVH